MAVHGKKTTSKDEDLEKDGELIDDELESDETDDEEQEEPEEESEEAEEPEAPAPRSSWDGAAKGQKNAFVFAALLFGVPLALILIIEIVSRGCGG